MTAPQQPPPPIAPITSPPRPAPPPAVDASPSPVAAPPDAVAVSETAPRGSHDGDGRRERHLDAGADAEDRPSVASPRAAASSASESAERPSVPPSRAAARAGFRAEGAQWGHRRPLGGWAWGWCGYQPALDLC